ncbi:MAG: hypothetical protein Q4G45_08745 [Actinomycetia bacterium]|nr:hypothetical protein [Actinomycetes bacterium]
MRLPEAVGSAQPEGLAQVGLEPGQLLICQWLERHRHRWCPSGGGIQV